MKTVREIGSGFTARVNLADSLNRSEVFFFEIANTLSGEDKNISMAKMMSSPGIKYKTKMIAFYHQDELVIRLGKSADLDALGIKTPKFLNPFKHKPSMTGWICFSYDDHESWEEFARIAIDVMKDEID